MCPAPPEHSIDVLESFIEIRDRETREVVTVVELLSPTNKAPGSDREQYLGKRKVLLAGNTHVVEIDLLRSGQRAPVGEMPECDYVVMVSRSYERPRVELWPLALSDPLPTIPIPLRLQANLRPSTMTLKPIPGTTPFIHGYRN